MSEETSNEPKGPSLLNQIMGAVVGGSLALGIYYAYEFGAPAVTAWLTLPQSSQSVSEDTETAAQQNLKPEQAVRINSRTREILSAFGQPGESQEISHDKQQVRGDIETLGSRRKMAKKTLIRKADHAAAEDNPKSKDRWQDVIERTQKILEPLDKPEEEPSETWEDPWEAGEGDVLAAHEGDSEELPSSGLELWLIVLAALAGACGWQYAKA